MPILLWKKLERGSRVFMNNNNDCYHIRMAAFHELREVLKIKLLIRAFVSSILWLVNYAKKNNVTRLRKAKLQKYKAKP
jgi:hypothetical protein